MTRLLLSWKNRQQNPWKNRKQSPIVHASTTRAGLGISRIPLFVFLVSPPIPPYVTLTALCSFYPSFRTWCGIQSPRSQPPFQTSYRSNAVSRSLGISVRPKRPSAAMRDWSVAYCSNSKFCVCLLHIVSDSNEADCILSHTVVLSILTQFCQKNIADYMTEEDAAMQKRNDNHLKNTRSTWMNVIPTL